VAVQADDLGVERQDEERPEDRGLIGARAEVEVRGLRLRGRRAGQHGKRKYNTGELSSS
jgi:hypothetical protein